MPLRCPLHCPPRARWSLRWLVVLLALVVLVVCAVEVALWAAAVLVALGPVLRGTLYAGVALEVLVPVWVAVRDSGALPPAARLARARQLVAARRERAALVAERRRELTAAIPMPAPAVARERVGSAR